MLLNLKQHKHINTYICCICLSENKDDMHVPIISLAANRQVNALFSWRSKETAKKMHRFLGSPMKPPSKSIVSLATQQNRQGIYISWLSTVAAKKIKFSLAV